MIKKWIAQTIKQLLSEIWGDKITYPLVRRFLAFTIDCILLILINKILAYIQYSTGISFNTLLLNLTIGILYFTIFNSRLAGGKTLGKRVFHIKLIDEQGELINILRSFLRGLPIVLLINFKPIGLSMRMQEMPYMYFINALLSLLYGILYFSILKTNRQGLHDLIFSTQVVTDETNHSTSKNLSTRLLLGFLIPVFIYTIWTLSHFH